MKTEHISIEIWKSVVGFEGLYEVSSFGRIRSIDKDSTKFGKLYGRRNGKILKQNILNSGYLYVMLSKKSKKYIRLVHRLVAESFIPNIKNFPVVNHRDENRLNNRVDNLEWCTYLYNSRYGTAIEKLKQNIKRRFNVSVVQLDLYSDTIIQEFESPTDAKLKSNGKFDQSAIRRCCIGNQKSHNGFRWCYKKNYYK